MEKPHVCSVTMALRSNDSSMVAILPVNLSLGARWSLLQLHTQVKASDDTPYQCRMLQTRCDVLSGSRRLARFLKALNTELPLSVLMACSKRPELEKRLKSYSVSRTREFIATIRAKVEHADSATRLTVNRNIR